ncbi:sentrin-specific protease 8-like, partial [Homalodisca vitripennis]|uniref:sentrin-specific protease 8-like n=1 Tax=Homalodisca vitripennis TaxID=197043 RepID=UPI001EEBE600
MTKKEDVVVLSYFDCVIRESDLKILKSNGWLNDAIIGFYFVYLEKERFNSNSELLFIGPEERYFRPSLELDFVELSSLQQDNSYDCGIYLICNLENIAEHINQHG